ncbi:MAG: oligosaccharide flippase family protein, partial [Dysgonomonas sp.]
MAINQLKAGAILSYVTVALNNVLGLVYTPYMLRMMGQSEYGLYSLANSIIIYLTIFDLGFGHTIVRYTAKLKSEGRINDLYAMFGMFIIIYSAISLIALMVGLVFYFNIDTFFGSTLSVEELGKTNAIMLLLLFNMSFTFIFTVFTSIISAYERFVFQRVVNIIRILFNTAIMIVLLEYGYKAIGMVVVATVCNVVSLLLNYWYCMHRIKIKIYFRRFKWGFFKELVQYSFYIFLIMIMDRIYMNSGQFVLGSLEGTVSVAIFALAIQFQ